MQMYIVSPILIYPLYKGWKIWKFHVGYTLAAAIYGSLTFYMGYVTVHYTLGPENGFMRHAVPGGMDQFNEMGDYYQKPWFRFQPYLIGMLLGYILFKTKNKEMKIPHVGSQLSNLINLDISYYICSYVLFYIRDSMLLCGKYHLLLVCW